MNEQPEQDNSKKVNKKEESIKCHSTIMESNVISFY